MIRCVFLLAGVLMVILKLLGWIKWSWWFVVSPFLVIVFFYLTLIALYFFSDEDPEL